MATVVDYSYNHPSIARLHSLSAIGVMRYVSPVAGKNLTLAEYRGLRAAGFSVGLVWEGSASGAKRGYSGGLSDARNANSQADALGYPKTAAIYYAVDFDDTASDLPVIREYFRGADDGSTRKVGVYGSYDVMQNVTTNYYWQTSAWSGGRLSSRADLYQHVYMSDVDLNDVKADDWGQDSYRAPVNPPFPLSAGNFFGVGGVMSDHGLNTWQRKMVSRGWSLSTNGVYDSSTHDAALAFQKEKGLVADSLIGVNTWTSAWTAPVT